MNRRQVLKYFEENKDFFENITPEKNNEKFAESIINAEKPKMPKKSLKPTCLNKRVKLLTVNWW